MSRTKMQLLLTCFSASLGLIILYYFDPASYGSVYPPSLSREWGGFYCAGCGMFRALHQLLHGNWQVALRLNPLLIIYLPYLVYWIAPYLAKHVYQINLYQIRHKNSQIIFTIVISIVYGILRNTSIPALSWLIPPS